MTEIAESSIAQGPRVHPFISCGHNQKIRKTAQGSDAPTQRHVLAESWDQPPCSSHADLKSTGQSNCGLQIASGFDPESESFGADLDELDKVTAVMDWNYDALLTQAKLGEDHSTDFDESPEFKSQLLNEAPLAYTLDNPFLPGQAPTSVVVAPSIVIRDTHIDHMLPSTPATTRGDHLAPHLRRPIIFTKGRSRDRDVRRVTQQNYRDIKKCHVSELSALVPDKFRGKRDFNTLLKDVIGKVKAVTGKTDHMKVDGSRADYAHAHESAKTLKRYRESLVATRSFGTMVVSYQTWTIAEANATMHEMLRKTPPEQPEPGTNLPAAQELEGKNFFSILHPSSIPSFISVCNTLMKSSLERKASARTQTQVILSLQWEAGLGRESTADPTQGASSGERARENWMESYCGPGRRYNIDLTACYISHGPQHTSNCMLLITAQPA